MSSDGSERPGGLTTLAVLNFIVAAMALLGAATFAGAVSSTQLREAVATELGRSVTDGWLWSAAAVGVVIGGLLIASGVGYLKQKRVAGRLLGNLYALIDLSNTAYLASNFTFDLTTVIGFIYPVLTLLLLNLTFKDDLVR